jgi:hypothetical protein
MPPKDAEKRFTVLVDDDISQPDPQDPGKTIYFKTGDLIALTPEAAQALLAEEKVKYVGEENRSRKAEVKVDRRRKQGRATEVVEEVPTIHEPAQEDTDE